MVCTAGQGDRLSPTRPPTPSPPSPSPAQGGTCEQGQRVSHQLVEGEVVVQLLPQRPPAALRGEEEALGQGWGRGRPRWPCRRGALTEQVPRRKERRLRQTGSRISMLLKLRHLADARAHAKADWGQEEGGEHPLSRAAGGLRLPAAALTPTPALPSMVLCRDWDRMGPSDAELGLSDAGLGTGKE